MSPMEARESFLPKYLKAMIGIWSIVAVVTACAGDPEPEDADDPKASVGPGCPINSGWPCACDEDSAVGCDDGADCIGFGGFESCGYYCAARCSVHDGDCPATEYDADHLCALSDGLGTYWCVLVCVEDEQCPPEQECIDTGRGASVCI